MWFSSGSVSPRGETRRTPRLAVVRARLACGPEQVSNGQLWDISRSGAAVCFRGAAAFTQGQEAMLQLRPSHGEEEVTIPARVRRVDGRHGPTFEGLQFGAGPLAHGSFLYPYLNVQAA
ncbi:MAG: PilZ domain-containing protein [Cyanobium sp.]